MNDFWNNAWLILAGLLPFLGFLVVCFVVVRAIFNADRNERKAVAQWEKAERMAHPVKADGDSPAPTP